MKKNKYLLIAIILSIFCSLGITFAYFKSSTDLISVFKTRNYSIKLNGLGGTFSGDNVTIINGKTTLPTPLKNGYQFLGYSNNQNGNTDYSVNISDINQINNKEIYAKWQIKTYSISYNLNGGTISGEKSTYNVEEDFTLPIPTRTGFSFLGWTGSNGNINQTNVIIQKGTTGNLNYIANWSANSYLVDVNPIIDGVTYNGGLSGYTFDVWINGTLVADDVIDFCQNIAYGSAIRVKTNEGTGANTNYDQTFTVGIDGLNINPTWYFNSYESHFYLDGVHRLTTVNKYGSYISTPNTNAGALGYDSNFYYLSGFTPWSTWYQPNYAVGFTINISEYNCASSFGSAGSSNSSYQLNKLRTAGYDFCSLTNWGSVECTGNYSKVMGLYNNVWNILPKSGNGFSIYKQISCDSGWSTYQRR